MKRTPDPVADTPARPCSHLSGRDSPREGLGAPRWLLEPARALMNRLSYPRKLALICLLLVLPLGLVLYLLVSEINGRIEFTRKEVHGCRYLCALRSLLEPVSACRVLAQDVAGGKVVQRPELVRQQAALEEPFEALARIDQELGGLLDTTSRQRALQENGNFLRRKLQELEPNDCADLHGQLLEELTGLLRHVGDTSNLILDPDLDTYYLMDAVLLRLPESADLGTQVRVLLRQQSAKSKGGMRGAVLAPPQTAQAEETETRGALLGHRRQAASPGRTAALQSAGPPAGTGDGLPVQSRADAEHPAGGAAAQLPQDNGRLPGDARSGRNLPAKTRGPVSIYPGPARERASGGDLPLLGPDHRRAGAVARGAH